MYAGLLPQPLAEREGPPAISEQQVMQILTSQQLSSLRRPREEERFHPYLMRHSLPLSAASAASAQPVSGLTMPISAAPSSSFEQIGTTIAIARQQRQQRRDERAPIGEDGTVAVRPRSPTAPSGVLPTGSPASVEPMTRVVIP